MSQTSPSLSDRAGDGETREDRLRVALSALFGAERRLRGRDHHRQGEITYGQLRCIAALGRDSELSAGELARRADLTPATVTVILDQLESDGIVQRRRSTIDRRICNVSLTPQGWELLGQRLEAAQGLWASRLADLGDDEIAAAAEVMVRIGEILDSMPGSLEPSLSRRRTAAGRR